MYLCNEFENNYRFLDNPLLKKYMLDSPDPDLYS